MSLLIPFQVKQYASNRGMAYNEYNDKVLEHFNHPRNVGRLDGRDARVGTGVAENPVKGDLIRFQVMVDNEGTIAAARFKAYGCGSTIASASVLTTLVIGLSVADAEIPRSVEIVRQLDLPPDKIAYAALAEEALGLALGDYRRKESTPAREKNL